MPTITPVHLSRDSSTSLGMKRKLRLTRTQPSSDMRTHFRFELLALTWLVTLGDSFAGQTPARTEHINRLARDKSPYLLQHAHNPVDWYPWGEEAFAKARRENKPICLSVGHSTCHGC